MKLNQHRRTQRRPRITLASQDGPLWAYRAEFVVGRLVCRRVRDFLSRTRFEGFDIQWWESSGLLEREFVVRGPKSAVDYVERTLKRWAAREGRE